MRIARALIGDRYCFGEVDANTFYPVADDIFAGVVRSGQGVPMDQVALLSPLSPRMVLLMVAAFLPPGESSRPAAEVPWMMPKLTSRIVADQGAILAPSDVAGPLWAEVELAVVVGTELCNADPDEARSGIFGFTCFNDVTVGELSPTMDLFRAKSVETFASMGPWIRTDLTEDDVRKGLRLTTSVNGVIRAEGNTRDFKFSVSEVVSFASRYPRLYPGDVISLGTPQVCQLQVGDVVELEVEGVGVLRNLVTASGDTDAVESNARVA